MPSAPGMDRVLHINGLTIDLPGRDEVFGRRVAKMLEEQLAQLDLQGISGGGLGPLQVGIHGDATEQEIVDSVVTAIADSLRGQPPAPTSGQRGDDRRDGDDTQSIPRATERPVGQADAAAGLRARAPLHSEPGAPK